MIDHEHEFRRGYHYAIFDEQERVAKVILADRSEDSRIDDLFDAAVFQSISRSEFKLRLIQALKLGNNEKEEADAS